MAGVTMTLGGAKKRPAPAPGGSPPCTAARRRACGRACPAAKFPAAEGVRARVAAAFGEEEVEKKKEGEGVAVRDLDDGRDKKPKVRACSVPGVPLCCCGGALRRGALGLRAEQPAGSASARANVLTCTGLSASLLVAAGR